MALGFFLRFVLVQVQPFLPVCPVPPYSCHGHDSLVLWYLAHGSTHMFWSRGQRALWAGTGNCCAVALFSGICACIYEQLTSAEYVLCVFYNHQEYKLEIYMDSLCFST